MLPPIIEDTKKFLDKAAKEESLIDLQDVLLELTTRLMGKVAYDVSQRTGFNLVSALLSLC